MNKIAYLEGYLMKEARAATLTTKKSLKGVEGVKNLNPYLKNRAPGAALITGTGIGATATA